MSRSGFGAGITALVEGVGIALESLRSNKTRAALTILGIAIGVMVVMAMAATVKGINSTVDTILEQSGEDRGGARGCHSNLRAATGSSRAARLAG